jgi:hypothetical protein
VVPRRVFAILTTLLVVITIVVAAVFCLQSLLASLGDVTGARVARWVGMAGLAALLIDALLLLAALGLNAMRAPDDRS